MNAEQHHKITAGHLARLAYLYVRQSTLRQVLEKLGYQLAVANVANGLENRLQREIAANPSQVAASRRSLALAVIG